MRITISLTLLAAITFLRATEPQSISPRRSPYKEVRTQRNQDPVVREALKRKMDEENKARAEHRKKVQAQMDAARQEAATNRLSSDTNFLARLREIQSRTNSATLTNATNRALALPVTQPRR